MTLGPESPPAPRVSLPASLSLSPVSCSCPSTASVGRPRARSSMRLSPSPAARSSLVDCRGPAPRSLTSSHLCFGVFEPPSLQVRRRRVCACARCHSRRLSRPRPVRCSSGRPDLQVVVREHNARESQRAQPVLRRFGRSKARGFFLSFTFSFCPLSFSQCCRSDPVTGEGDKGRSRVVDRCPRSCSRSRSLCL